MHECMVSTLISKDSAKPASMPAVPTVASIVCAL
jgi:hypothetical protein